MKFNEETMQTALELFIKNDFWKDIYAEASETVKKRLRVAFWGSEYMDEREDIDSYREYRESVENEMTYDDAAYLAERFPDGAGRRHYTAMRDRLETASIRTPEKLNAATEKLMEGGTASDHEMVKKTQQLLRHCEDPWVKYEWIWGAVGGNGDDCEWLGDTFDHGHGVEPDRELAHFWFRRGAFSGHGDSCARLAAVYEEEGPRFDMEKVKFWFIEALRRNSINAKIDLGARLTTWKEGPWTKFRNPEAGVKLLWSATKYEYASRAHFFLGECYEEGAGVARNLQAAMRHYKIAAKDEILGAGEALDRVSKLIREEK